MSDERSGCCSSFLVGLLSFLVGALGVAIIVVSVLVKKDKLSDDGYFPKCDDCYKIFYVLWAFGAVLVVAGIMGIAAAYRRSRALAIPFIILMVLSMLAFIAIMVLVILFEKKPNILHLDKAWATTVSDDPKVACKIEEHLHCSGYSSCCGSSSSDMSFVTVASPATRLMAPVKPAASDIAVNNELIVDQDIHLVGANSSCTAPSDQCPSDCSHNSYTTSCERAMIHFVQQYLWAIVGVDAAVIVFSILVAVLAGRLHPGTEDDTHPLSGSFQDERERSRRSQTKIVFRAPKTQDDYQQLLLAGSGRDEFSHQPQAPLLPGNSVVQQDLYYNNPQYSNMFGDVDDELFGL